MIKTVKKAIDDALHAAGVKGKIALLSPPKPEMGDFAFACFGLAKEWKKNPNEIAKELMAKLGNKEIKKLGVIDKVIAAGSYVNFFINAEWLAKEVLNEVDEEYGRLKIGQKKKYLVEFGCPNPLKVFHLGHLKNLITGESVARILANAGYKVVRVNYQGDVGLHIAKALWALETRNSKFEIRNSQPLEERIKFLGEMYAKGAQAFEENEQVRAEIVAMNKRVYEKDPEIQELYQLAVAWSLEYFDQIYKRLGARFDRLYMESEVFEPGEKIVRQYLQKGIFKESRGAIIYEGSKHGLHDRVFINSEGFPTYEAKDLGLAEAHFTEYKPDRIIHVVGKEQIEYFKVVFKAIGAIWSERADKEFHLPGGFLQLKGSDKMSSRSGNVVPAEELLALAVKEVGRIMEDRELSEKEKVIETVAAAAVKYAILKVGVSDDVAFDLKTSVSLEGDSGPYLLYIVARIRSILRKLETRNSKLGIQISDFRFPFSSFEKSLLLQLVSFPEITFQAAESLDPSKIAQYLFHLAQTFNTFYHECPVLEAEAEVRAGRVRLIQAVAQVMTTGLTLLGIETVVEM